MSLFLLEQVNGFLIPCHAYYFSVQPVVGLCVCVCCVTVCCSVILQPYVDIIFCLGGYDKYMSHRSIMSHKDEIITHHGELRLKM